MGLEQDIASTAAYITRASRRINRHNRVAARSRNPRTVATARDLVSVLTVLLGNVQRKHRLLRQAARKH